MSYDPAKFGGHGHSGSGVIRNLVLSRDLARPRRKRACDFMGGSPSWQVTTLQRLVTISIVVMEI